jgi:divinyl chlorophyllide a 8-vinyl-reductase
MVDCLGDAGACNRILPIGGPGPALTPRAQGELLFELAGRTPRFRSVPVAMFGVAEALIAPFARVSDAAAKKAELARIGRYYATESMLLWDDRRARYDADATPETGSETLRDHYARVLEEGLAGHELGDHKLF